jgi:hypothetical protein
MHGQTSGHAVETDTKVYHPTPQLGAIKSELAFAECSPDPHDGTQLAPLSVRTFLQKVPFTWPKGELALLPLRQSAFTVMQSALSRP